MGNFKAIKKQAMKGHNAHYASGGRCAYATGGRVAKRPTTVINIVTPERTGAQGPSGTGPALPPPPMPKPPVPPMAGNAALGAMGGQPMLATGGRVKARKVPKMTATATGFKGKLPMEAGAGGGAGRLKKAANPKAKYPLT